MPQESVQWCDMQMALNAMECPETSGPGELSTVRSRDETRTCHELRVGEEGSSDLDSRIRFDWDSCLDRAAQTITLRGFVCDSPRRLCVRARGACIHFIYNGPDCPYRPVSS